ncbi:MAG TPA: DUF2059 domain-containing protein [Bryobacteraceae bacterium]
MYKRALISGIGLIVAISPLIAAQQPAETPPSPAKAALIQALFRLTKPGERMQQMLAQYKAAFSHGAEEAFNTQVQKFDDPSKYQSAFHKFEDQMFALIEERLSWSKLEPQFAQLYSEAYTTQELSDMVAFYKSPTGQAVLRKTPALIAKCSALGQHQLGDIGPVIQKMVNDYCANLKKEHDAARSSKPEAKS